MRPASVYVVHRESESRTVIFPLPERLDDDSVVERKLASSFVDKFFKYREPESRDKPVTEPRMTGEDFHARHPRLSTRAYTEDEEAKSPRAVTYETEKSHFRIEQTVDRLRLTNKTTIKLSQQSRRLPLGLDLNIPEDAFALVSYRHPNNCICLTSVAGPGRARPELRLLNATAIPISVSPGGIRAEIRVFPYFHPEPWQTVNLEPPPHDQPGFHLQLKRGITVRPRETHTLAFGVTHLCADDCDVLILPTELLSDRGVVARPGLWRAHDLPVVHLTNISTAAVYLPPRTSLAMIVFTVPGFLLIPNETVLARELRTPPCTTPFIPSQYKQQ